MSFVSTLYSVEEDRDSGLSVSFSLVENGHLDVIVLTEVGVLGRTEDFDLALSNVGLVDGVGSVHVASVES